MALRALALIAMLGLGISFNSMSVSIEHDPKFEIFMNSGNTKVYALFEEKSVETSERFYAFMRSSYINRSCSTKSECAILGEEAAKDYARTLRIKMETPPDAGA